MMEFIFHCFLLYLRKRRYLDIDRDYLESKNWAFMRRNREKHSGVEKNELI